MPSAIVLGARKGTGNIGDAILSELEGHDWRAVADDCWRKDAGRFEPPLEHELKPYSALVCSTGRACICPWEEVAERDLQDVIAANLTLPLVAAHRYVQARRRDGGRIVFIGSYAHDHVLSNSAAYCAAKAGLNHAARCLAWDLGERFPIHVINPYHVEGTPMEGYVIQAIMEGKGLDADGAREYQRKDLRGDPLTAPEVAAVVARLITGGLLSNRTIGQPINLYGGVR